MDLRRMELESIHPDVCLLPLFPFSSWKSLDMEKAPAKQRMVPEAPSKTHSGIV